jgi:predicted acetyltransferase
MALDLVLRRPTEDEEPVFLRTHRATSPGYLSFLHYYEPGMQFRQYLEVLAGQEQGINLPSPNHVPETFLFAFVGKRIVGRTSIRHSLNPSLLRVGGHIGYVVVPEFRRRGYGTTILALSVRIARDRLGLERVLVTCDDDNIGSIRVIQKNGGILENIVTGPDLDKPTCRYWIDTGRQTMRDSSFWSVTVSRVLGTYAILIFALLWVGSAIALVVNPEWLDLLWNWVRVLPSVVEILVWVLCLPIMVGLWIWESSWPVLARLLACAGIVVWTLLAVSSFLRAVRSR